MSCLTTIYKFFIAMALTSFWLVGQARAAESASGLNGEGVVAEFNRLMDKKDYLSARVFLKKYWGVKINRGQWKRIRKRMHHEPKVGWDFVRGWDTKGVALGGPSGQRLDENVRQADQLFSKRQYKAAFELYRSAATAVQKGRLLSENRYLYFDLVTSMARSLYVSGDFMRAYRLYGWIPPIYPRYKQILFERMWAAFRAGEIEHALGDLIAQYSPFFGGVINPEAFLVQIYAYKKLCLDEDLGRVLLLVEKFRKRLEENGFSVQEWALSDWETMPLARLSEQKDFVKSDFVLPEEREAEKQRVIEVLKRKYELERRDYLANLGKVSAYAKMAFDLSTKELTRVRELPDPAALIAQRLEMWPIDGPEDWLDEIGHKFFLGKSQCGAEAKESKIQSPPSPALFSQQSSVRF